MSYPRYGTSRQVHAVVPTTLFPRHRSPSAPSARTTRVAGGSGKIVATGADVRTPPPRRQPNQGTPGDGLRFTHSARSALVPRANRSPPPFASSTAAGASVVSPVARRKLPSVYSQMSILAPTTKTSSRLGHPPPTAGNAAGSLERMPPRRRQVPFGARRQRALSVPRT